MEKSERAMAVTRNMRDSDSRGKTGFVELPVRGNSAQRLNNGGDGLPASSGFSKYRDPRQFRPISGKLRNEMLVNQDIHKLVLEPSAV